MRRPTPVAVLWGTGALAILAAEQGWWSATAGAATVTLSGAQATDGLARSLALVALVGVLLTLTLRAFGRRVVASALGATYVGIALLGLGRPAPGADVVAAELSAATFADAARLTPSAWNWAYAVAGVTGAVASLWLAARPGVPTRRGVGERRAPLDDSLASWKAMDDGVDPTAGTTEREDQR